MRSVPTHTTNGRPAISELRQLVVGGRLEPRHVDLRAFAFVGDDVALLPGGLTRVTLDADTLVVNSSQRGGGKDTRVVD